MAGSDPRFNADQFVEAIKFAMQMGAPPSESRRLTFHWDPVNTFVNAAPSGLPYGVAQSTATSETHADVQIDCAIDWTPGSSAGVSSGTPIGRFDRARMVITIVGDDYDDVQGADTCSLDGKIYDIEEVHVDGLFTVPVYTLVAIARDEGRD